MSSPVRPPRKEREGTPKRPLPQPSMKQPPREPASRLVSQAGAGQPTPRESTGLPARPLPRQQTYRRTSAIIPDRPDGKPVLFGYGQHMTRKEKDRLQRLLAYGALAAVVAICAIILVSAAVYNGLIMPNQTVASVNGHGIPRKDRDAMVRFYTAQAAAQQAQGGQVQGDPATQAVQQLQNNVLTQISAKDQFGITVSDSDTEAQLKQTQGFTEAKLSQLLTAYGLSRDEYKRLIVAPSVYRTRVGDRLTANNPKVAAQWHYARILLKDKKSADAVFKQLAFPTAKTPDFAFLARTKSQETVGTNTDHNNGDLGWLRPSDTNLDPLFQAAFLSPLQGMKQTNARYKEVQDGTQWYVIEYLGYESKRSLSDAQKQADGALKYNDWFKLLQAKARFDPIQPSQATPIPTAPAQVKSNTVPLQIHPATAIVPAKVAPTAKK